MDPSPTRAPFPDPGSHAHLRVLSRRTLLRVLALGGAVVAVPGLAGCGGQAGSGDVAMSKVPRRDAPLEARPDGIRVISSFTGKLFAAVASKPGNIVCSPYSVALALAMARNGARGSTATEMDRVLKATSLDSLNAGLSAVSQVILSRDGEKTKLDGTKTDVVLEVANSIFGQTDTTWEEPFLDALATNYGAGVQLVDFKGAAEAARTRINEWTKSGTGDAIPEILPEGVLTAQTRMVLVNALHLKAPWADPFDEKGTRPAPFNRADGTSVQTDMMHLTTVSGEISHGPGWTATRLLYAGNELGIALVLPDKGRDADLLKQLGESGLGTLLGSFERGAQVDLTMPKFDFGYGVSLKEILSSLGMPTAFLETADFSGMTKEEKLLLTAVLHQGKIAVDEQGTEASAATAVVAGTTSAPTEKVTIVLDRPFVFVIHDVETATPIFIGRVSNPTAAA